MPAAEVYAEEIPAMVEETITPAEFGPPAEVVAEEIPYEDPDATLAPSFEGFGADASLSTGAKVGLGFTLAALVGAIGWAGWTALRR